MALVHQSTLSDLTISDLHQGRDFYGGETRPPRPRTRSSPTRSRGAHSTSPYEISEPARRRGERAEPGAARSVARGDVPVHGVGARVVPGRDGARRGAGSAGVPPRAAAERRARDRRVRDRSHAARRRAPARRRAFGVGSAPPSDRATQASCGLAANVYHGGSYLAQVAEVSLAPDLSDLRIHRIVCVIDCGLALNPEGLLGQTESGDHVGAIVRASRPYGGFAQGVRSRAATMTSPSSAWTRCRRSIVRPRAELGAAERIRRASGADGGAGDRERQCSRRPERAFGACPSRPRRSAQRKRARAFGSTEEARCSIEGGRRGPGRKTFGASRSIGLNSPLPRGGGRSGPYRTALQSSDGAARRR